MTNIVERLRDLGEYDEGKINDTRIEAAADIKRLQEALQHCINAIAEYEKDSSESIRPFLLGAMDNAKKVLNK